MDAAIRSLQDEFARRFSCDSFVDLMETFESIAERPITDLQGYVDISVWKEHMPTVKSFIRAIFYPMFLLGAIKYLQWVIRGSSSLNAMAPSSQPDSKGGGK